MFYYINGFRKSKEEFDKELKKAVGVITFSDNEHSKEEVKEFNHLLQQCYTVLRNYEKVTVNYQTFELKSVQSSMHYYINKKEVTKPDFDTALSECVTEEIYKDPETDVMSEEEILKGITKLYKRCKISTYEGKEVLIGDKCFRVED